MRSPSMVSYILLYLLRKNLIQYLLHFHPEFSLLIFQMSCYEIGALDYFWRVFGVHEMAIGSAIWSWEGIYFDTSLGGLEFFRMEDIEDSAGIMDGWEGEFIIIVVHDLELLKHIVNCLGERNLLVGFEVVDYLLGCHVFMCDLEGNHNQRDISF